MDILINNKLTEFIVMHVEIDFKSEWLQSWVVLRFRLDEFLLYESECKWIALVVKIVLIGVFVIHHKHKQVIQCPDLNWWRLIVEIFLTCKYIRIIVCI